MVRDLVNRQDKFGMDLDFVFRWALYVDKKGYKNLSDEEWKTV